MLNCIAVPTFLKSPFVSGAILEPRLVLRTLLRHRVQEAEYDVQMLLDIERGDLKLQEEKDKTEGYHRV